MRRSGMPNFPDPSANGVIQGSNIDPQSEQFRAAERKCQKYLGHKSISPAQTQQMLAQLLKYSQCMRSHGVSAFPDPSTSGGAVTLKVNASPGSGLDPSSPAFLHAQQACASLAGAPAPLTSSGGGNK
jgi:hypothetical protein